MKRILLGIAGLAALLLASQAASAADMAVKAPPKAAPPPTWTGFYVGLNGGIGWGQSKQTDTFGATSGWYNQDGIFAGGTIGANYQINNIVVGAEADFDWAGIKGSATLPVSCTAGRGTTCFTDVRWLSTYRGRVGVVFKDYLIYLTGGEAGTSVHDGQAECSTPVVGAVAACGTTTMWRPTYGGGIEGMIAPNWSAKLEYLYANFGTKQSYTVFIPVNVSEKVNLVRFGLNYHFY
jgi:outer membrane immunogenic protein